MGEMIGNIAHQWRQPLSVISTSATGMQMQQEYGVITEDSINQACEAINDNAQYLSKTIDDFKNFIKGNRKKERFNLKDSIDSFLHLLEGTIKANDIKLILDIKDDIEINGYSNEIIQCLINIFNNAKDALKEHNIDPKLVFVTTKKDDKFVYIEIKDNAKGIPTNILPKIFEPYFTTKHKSRGTGLGLHMTYNLIIKGMNGTIEAKNVIYKNNNIEYTGALFTIAIPL
jgi:signal transduction histidine kinase